mmetsp:Transcript_15980/g.23550  ORF Transcript_15980/g.23550 Transcript_15980/m.23550 type:complete len:221 (-) Transcript_15980:676-1338(-)
MKHVAATTSVSIDCASSICKHTQENGTSTFRTVRSEVVIATLFIFVVRVILYRVIIHAIIIDIVDIIGISIIGIRIIITSSILATRRVSKQECKLGIIVFIICLILTSLVVIILCHVFTIIPVRLIVRLIVVVNTIVDLIIREVIVIVRQLAFSKPTFLLHLLWFQIFPVIFTVISILIFNAIIEAVFPVVPIVIPLLTASTAIHNSTTGTDFRSLHKLF